MSYNAKQLRSLVERSLQRRNGLYSPAAVEIVLGTAAQESAFGTYLVQMGNGPAKGAYQMEPPTYKWLHEKFIPKMPELARYAFVDLEWNLDHATVMCRLLYRAYPDPLPEPDDVAGMAALYKKRYNGPGKATEQEFIDNYHRYVA